MRAAKLITRAAQGSRRVRGRGSGAVGGGGGVLAHFGHLHLHFVGLGNVLLLPLLLLLLTTLLMTHALNSARATAPPSSLPTSLPFSLHALSAILVCFLFSLELFDKTLLVIDGINYCRYCLSCFCCCSSSHLCAVFAVLYR